MREQHSFKLREASLENQNPERFCIFCFFFLAVARFAPQVALLQKGLALQRLRKPRH